MLEGRETRRKNFWLGPSILRCSAKLKRHAGKDGTFRAVAEEVIAKQEREGRAHATLSKRRWLLDFAFPAFGDRPVAEITARELLALLREIEGRGLYETARRLRSTCGMVFRYAIATGRAERDPSMDLRGALTSPRSQSPRNDRRPGSHWCAATRHRWLSTDNRQHTLRYGLRHMFLSGQENCGKRSGGSSILMGQCGASQPKR